MSFTNDALSLPVRLYEKMGQYIADGWLRKVTKKMRIVGDPIGKKMIGDVGITGFGGFPRKKTHETLKKTMGVFKAAGKPTAGAALGVLLMILDKVMEMHPAMKVFSALFDYFISRIILNFMPLIIPFIEMLTSPEALACIDAIALCISMWLYPSFEVLLAIMMELGPYIPHITNVLNALAISFYYFGWVSGPIGPILYVIASGMIQFRLATIAASLMIKQLTEYLENLSKFWGRVGQGGGSFGGGGGSSGGVGGTVRRAVSSARKALGLHEGTPFVPHTGWWYLKKGEKVETPTQQLAKESQMEQMLMMEQQVLDYQEKMYKLWRNRL